MGSGTGGGESVYVRRGAGSGLVVEGWCSEVAADSWVERLQLSRCMDLQSLG